MAVQSFLNAGFRSATQAEFVVMNGEECLHALQRRGVSEFRNAFKGCPLHCSKTAVDFMKRATLRREGGSSQKKNCKGAEVDFTGETRQGNVQSRLKTKSGRCRRMRLEFPVSQAARSRIPSEHRIIPPPPKKIVCVSSPRAVVLEFCS